MIRRGVKTANGWIPHRCAMPALCSILHCGQVTECPAAVRDLMNMVLLQPLGLSRSDTKLSCSTPRTPCACKNISRPSAARSTEVTPPHDGRSRSQRSRLQNSLPSSSASSPPRDTHLLISSCPTRTRTTHPQPLHKASGIQPLNLIAQAVRIQSLNQIVQAFRSRSVRDVGEPLLAHRGAPGCAVAALGGKGLGGSHEARAVVPLC